MPVACGSQKRALDPPALELRMVVSHHVSSGFQIQVPLQERRERALSLQSRFIRSYYVKSSPVSSEQ